MLQQVFAQVNTTGPASTFGTGWTLFNFFTFILNLLLGAGFSLTLIMLAMGFIQYILAQGDKVGVEKAQKWVTYAVIGGLGLFLIFAIRSALQSLIGANGSNFNIGTGVNI